MKVTSVSLLSADQETLRFDLRNVTETGAYQVKQIIGLDADDLIPKFYSFSLDGSKKFYDVALKPRDIVILIKLNPRFHLDETHSYLRDQLYKVILARRTAQIELQFHEGGSTVARTYGFITKFEAPHFTKSPQVQITIRCNDPLFRGINPTIMNTADLGTVNPIVVADSSSTAPHGFHLSATVISSIPEFSIHDKATNPEWRFRLLNYANFNVGDVINISSEYGNRYAYMIRGGVTTHLMDIVEPISVWPIIFPGFNSFHFPYLSSFTLNYIRYDTTYWGI